MLRRLAAVLGVVAGSSALFVSGSLGTGTADIRWRPFVSVPGVVDVAGPRSDGRLIVAGRDGLFLIRRNGSIAPFARGTNGYTPARGEAYIALAHSQRVPRAGCSFRRDDVFALDPVDHPGVILISRNGRARRFADLPAGNFLSSIAFDTVGGFGNRLLVTAVVGNLTTLYEIDCSGRTRAIMRGVARVEGGAAVAPARFSRFGGQLVAVDELTGNIYAFSRSGHVKLVARPNLRFGADIGVESIGFVPRGFGRSGAAFLADLGAPGSPTEGTDSVLKLSGAKLLRAGVKAGDLLAATEAGGLTISVRCLHTCTVRRVGGALDATHGEGHIAVVAH